MLLNTKTSGANPLKNSKLYVNSWRLVLCTDKKSTHNFRSNFFFFLTLFSIAFLYEIICN